MDVISHPFRLRPGGTVATVADGSDEHRAELVASMALTVRGERGLVPAYGIEDPAFGGFDAADLTGALELFAPGLIDLLDVEITYPSDGVERVVLRYE